MKLSKVLGLSSAFLAVLSFQALAQEVAGTVVDSRSGRPLDRVQVVAEGGAGTRTDTRGRFRITGLTGAQVTLNVALIGYRPLVQQVQVGNTQLVIQLT